MNKFSFYLDNGRLYRYELYKTTIPTRRCDVCGKESAPAYAQSEIMLYSRGFTFHGCDAHFGHRGCLMDQRRGQRVHDIPAPVIDAVLAYLEAREEGIEVLHRKLSTIELHRMIYADSPLAWATFTVLAEHFRTGPGCWRDIDAAYWNALRGYGWEGG